MKHTLEFREICKSFAGVRVLDRVSFSVEGGEVLALVGENGAGKSTLLKILNGDYQQMCIRDRGVVYALPQESPAEFSSGASAEALPSEDTSGYPYLLRSYDGKLAVFTDDLVEPDLVFDVYVRTLPEYDQQQLERGVRVKDYDKLTALIEDYIS